MTEMRAVEISIYSAEGLKNAKILGRMRSYVVAYVNPAQMACTNVDQKGGRNPIWNENLRLCVAEQFLQHPHAGLMLEIYCDKNEKLGYVRVPLLDVLERKNDASRQVMRSEVRRPSGRSKGVLNYAVRLGDSFVVSSDEPVLAFPSPFQHNFYSFYPPQSARSGDLGFAASGFLQEFQMVAYSAPHFGAL